MRKKIIFIALLLFIQTSSYSVEPPQKFFEWLEKSTVKLNSRSRVIQTASGPIECRLLKGKGPTIVSLHGGPGGYDQSCLIASSLVKAGFTVLGVSRPGYLRTPLSVGTSIQEQADAIKSLLDALGISRVAILGFSAGAPIAFQFALRHPDRTWALVIEGIGCAPHHNAFYESLMALTQYPALGDFGSWLLHVNLRNRLHSTTEHFLSMDNDLKFLALKKRVDYVQHHKRQLRLLKKFIDTIIPLGPRSPGLANDLANLDPWATFPFESIQAPTMVIQASNDDVIGCLNAAKTAAQRIPNAKLVLIKDSGHFMWFGPNTKQWEGQLALFLKQNGS